MKATYQNSIQEKKHGKLHRQSVIK